MKNKFNHALDRELKSVRVSESLKMRIIAAAEAEKRRQQRKRILRMLSGIAAVLVIMLGVSAFMLNQRPAIPDVQNHPLTHGVPSTAEPPAPGPDPAFTAVPMDAVETTPESTPTAIALLDEKTVWATEKGQYYHSEKNCSGMKDAENVSIKTAMERGQGACPVCRPPVYMPDGGEPTPEPTLTPVPESPETLPVLVWATKEGAYYHAEEHCSGMRNAGQITLETTVLWNKKACPICRPPEVESEDSFGEAMGDIESLMAWHYGGKALMAEYSFERNPFQIGEVADPQEWYTEEIDEDTFNMRNATWHMLSDEDYKLLEEAYFMNFEAGFAQTDIGFAQNDITLISEDVATQNMSSTESLPAGTEYHFCSPDEPADRIIFYDMNEDSPWTADHMLMTRFTKLRLWYFDGKKVYQNAQTLDGPQSLRVPVHDAGGISGHTTEVDVQGHKIEARLWQTEDMYILVLAPEEGVQLNPDATGWMDENGEGMRPYMALDTSTCNDGMLGWIFRGDVPESGDSLMIGLGDGSAKSFACKVLEAERPETKENPTVWATNGGAYYHVQEYCSGMKNARETDALTAAFEGKQPCPVCDAPSVQTLSDESGVTFSFSQDATQRPETENLHLSAKHYAGENGDILLLGGEYQGEYTFIPHLADSASPDWMKTPMDAGFEEWALENLKGRFSEETIHEWFRLRADDPGMGIMKDRVFMTSRDINTQIVGIGDPSASGVEYRFVNPENHDDFEILYDIEGSWQGDEINLRLVSKQDGWYYDGKNLSEYESTMEFSMNPVAADEGGASFHLEISDVISNRAHNETMIVPANAGNAEEYDRLMNAGGKSVRVKIWKMDSRVAVAVIPEDGKLSGDTCITDANGVTIRADKVMDGIWHPEWKGWIFRNDIFVNGATICVAMENGEKETISLEKLMGPASMEGEAIPEGINISAYSGKIPEGGILMLDYECDVEKLGHDVRISLQDRAGSDHAFTDGFAYAFTDFESGHETLVYLTDWHCADETVSVIVSGIPGNRDAVITIPVEQAENCGSSVGIYQKIKGDDSVRQDFYMIGEYQIAILEIISKDAAVMRKGVESLFMDNWESGEPMGMIKSGNENPGVTGWMVKNADKGFSLKSIDPDLGWEDVYVYLPGIIQRADG